MNADTAELLSNDAYGDVICLNLARPEQRRPRHYCSSYKAEGLALAKGLAEAMHGSLTVESTIDSGSAFRVELPASEARAVHRDVAQTRRAVNALSAGTVLYIEDNLSNLTLMQRLIKRRPNVQLLEAREGGTGVSMVRERRPDLVFLDIHLPDCPGEEVLRQIWEDPATRTIPVVVLSADATPAQKRRLLASGATAVSTSSRSNG